MKTAVRLMAAAFALLISVSWSANAQSTSGVISGTVTDPQGAVIAGASVSARNVGTNESRSTTADGEGRYRFPNLPIGNYEVTIQAQGFAKYVRTGVELLLNQEAVVNAPLKTTTVEEVVTINENASLLNTTNAEVSTRFDSKRLSELPLATNRNVFNVALSAAGISQLASGQSNFATGISYSSNGGRLRSNNFMIDGQDINDPSVAGGQQPLNNPDIIQEVRLITNQFAAEYGRNSGSVFSVVTKSGTNQYHGSGFWFNNNNHFNSCSNLDKAGRPGGYCNPTATRDVQKGAPFRLENQFGGTFGGPLYLPRFGEGGSPVVGGKDKTWFFGSLQRWTDRQLGSGFTLSGAPTEAGRQILQSAAGSRPQVAALLRFLPAAQKANNTSATFALNGQNFTVPLGDLTGSTSLVYNDWQWSGRIDHQFNEKHRLNGRYLYDGNLNAGTGQATPPGLTTVVPTRSQAAVINLNSLLSPRVVNDARIAWSRFGSRTTASDPSSEEIPSIEIAQLGLNEFNASASRTAIGLAVNLQMQFGLRLTGGGGGEAVVEPHRIVLRWNGDPAGTLAVLFAWSFQIRDGLIDLPVHERDAALRTLATQDTALADEVALQVAEQMSDFLLHGAVTNALNMPSVTVEEAPKLRPYMKLADQLGTFAGQATETGIMKVIVEYEGQVSALNTRPLTALMLQGLLKPQLSDSVNMVNAPLVAKERNIDLTEIKHDREGDYHTLIRFAPPERLDRELTEQLDAIARLLADAPTPPDAGVQMSLLEPEAGPSALPSPSLPRKRERSRAGLLPVANAEPPPKVPL